jgi:Carboxypeptidase regulatory-like domain
MKTLFIAILISASFFAQAGSGIFGKITNATSDPISNALVMVYDSSYNLLTSIYTNTNGDYGFNLPMATNYILQIANNDDTTQYISGIVVENVKPTVLNFAMTNKISNVRKSMLGNNYLKTSAAIERMPSTDINSAVVNTGAFKTSAEGGVLRTVGLPTSNVQYIIDGQIVPTGSAVKFTPGAVNSIEVLKK